MKKITLLFALLIIPSVFCFSQEEEDEDETKTENNAEPTVVIDSITNNVDDFNLFRVRVPVWEFTLAKYNVSVLDLSAGLFYKLGNKFNFNLDYSFALGDRQFPETSEGQSEGRDLNMFAINKYSSANYITGGITYFFNEQKEEKEFRIAVNIDSKKRVQYYTMVMGTELKRIGVHLGYTQGVTWYNMNSSNINAQSLDNPNEALEQYNYDSQTTWMEYSNLHVGMTFSKLHNLAVTCVGHGRRRNTGLSTLTIDMLYSIRNQLDDVYIATDFKESQSFQNNSGTIYYGRYNINDYNKKLKVGASITYRNFGLDSFASPIFELGYLPGVLSNINLYAKIGITLYVGRRIKD